MNESELFTSDTSKTIIHELVPSLYKKVNLVTESSAHSETETRESVRDFQHPSMNRHLWSKLESPA